MVNTDLENLEYLGGILMGFSQRGQLRESPGNSVQHRGKLLLTKCFLFIIQIFV